MGRPKRKQREIDLRRKDILDAAARVFARKGFAGASMQEIAAEAGYGASSLYAYFPNKQAISDALAESVTAGTGALFDVVIPAGLMLRQRLELLLHHQFGWIEANRDAVVFFSQGAQQAEVDFLYVNARNLAAWLEANAEPGQLAAFDALTAATALNALNYGFFLRWVREGAQGTPRQFVPTILDLFFNGLQGPRAA